jgi:hypothetical protein
MSTFGICAFYCVAHVQSFAKNVINYFCAPQWKAHGTKVYLYMIIGTRRCTRCLLDSVLRNVVDIEKNHGNFAVVVEHK